jgi:uncharacterized protein
LNKDAIYWINKLNLKEHPEGGYFTQAYVSDVIITSSEHRGPRFACTAIYYLLVEDQFSSFHTMKSDELWHFYDGSSVTLHIIGIDGELYNVKLGKNIENDERFQAVVKSGTWFAASVDDVTAYSLVGCTVSPGFDYQDWRLGDVEELNKLYPRHKSTIEKYTRRNSRTK